MWFKYPRIIVGGMGTGVSNAQLVRAAIFAGHWGEILGVVSGIVQLPIKARQLQKVGGYRDAILRALERFPNQEIAQEFKKRYYIEAGIKPGQRFKAVPVFNVNNNSKAKFTASDFNVLAVFLEVTVAKEGHNRPVGINLMNHLQVPIASSLYGAMLAKVDYVLMGAGIPIQVASILNDLAQNKPVEYRLNVIGADKDDKFVIKFNPARIVGKNYPNLNRPKFMPIISFDVLAKMLLKGVAKGDINGFIVEGPTAGGHNANPRKPIEYNYRGEPIYTERDRPNLTELWRMCKLHRIPYYLAGGQASPEAYFEARFFLKAQGIQVGSIFALCNESGLKSEIRAHFISEALSGSFDNKTDALASPSGFAFKVASMPGTISEQDIYDARPRCCDLGYLRDLYKKPDGTIGYRCPAEDIEKYQAKGGKLEDTEGRKCLCNCLVSNIDLAQVQIDDYEEPFGVTLGDDLSFVPYLCKNGKTTYSAAEAANFLLGR